MRERVAGLTTLCRSVAAGAGMLAAMCLVVPAAAQQIVAEDVELPDLEGGRWGVSVVSLDGGEVYAVATDQRFAPASTLKLVTSAAAFRLLGDFEGGRWPSGTSARLEATADSVHPNIVLIGAGDPTLSASSRCYSNCLQALADAVVESGVTQLNAVDVDDSLFQPPHWPSGWTHEDFRFGYATSISALSVDSGVARARLTPGSRRGLPPEVTWNWVPFFEINTDEAETVSTRQFSVDLIRRPGAEEAYLLGRLPLASPPVHLQFGLDDPSLYAGEVLKAMLEERGVTVHGQVFRGTTVHEPVADSDPTGPLPDFVLPGPDPALLLEEVLHESNNFYTEVLLHHISLTARDRSQDAGLELMGDMLVDAGAARSEFSLADGSGLSVYNRLTPSAMTDLLVWASRQSWFDTWYGHLSQAGVDGTLRYRFTEMGRDDRFRAKTGSLTGTGSLAGYFETRDGRRFAFAVFANDSSLRSSATRRRIDELLQDVIDQLD
ncbi:D-alanyl-D-alanine carboxypeptidase/D-alanyl-D-alanine-endopeptidase [Henriciella barbarensis]|uniref:D-alanyl-D-alanine carboxypeptidase/D-alanyl-D-alanine-endopeptidase n=1 Tax=Henriciella barbarensis TaxID=86342 RepID=A0A399QQ45_9PROT|nr:D-alanyl-D-alanine carboxypeptidase/D-alanyl-D-alanine-endopeptidase [Henriciella barbarensis]RIJ20611.1 D-alanyl-D-alanine carboxypeptidase/D-alanyl-D-alanine-endopeptidase [Henriciella barbarensis]